MDETGSLVERGAALRDAEDYVAAIETLRKAVEAGEPEAPRLLALALLEVDDHEAARDVLIDAVEAGRGDLAELLGDIADDLDDAPLAERAYRIAVDGGDKDALNDYAIFLQGQGRHDESIRLLEQAIGEGDPLAAGNLVLLYLEDLHDVEKARELGEQYLDERHPKTLTGLAAVYSEMGRLDDAENLYLRAVELAAPRAHINLGRFLRECRDDIDGAEQQFDLARRADEAGWGYHLGELLRDTGRVAEAAEVLGYAASWGDRAAAELLAELRGAR